MALLIAVWASCDPMLSPSFRHVLYSAEFTKAVDHDWKGMVCCCVLVGIVHAVPFLCLASSDFMRAATENVRLLFRDHLSKISVMKDE